MTGQLNRVDVTVLPIGWTNIATGSFPSEVSGSWSPALSPDGRHMAYVSDRSGRPQVWVQPVGSDLTFLVDTGEAPVASVQWSTGGGWLACLVAPGGAPRHEMWLVRPDGSELHQVAGFGADTADNPRWLPGRSLLALTENLTTALLIDPVGNTRSVVATGTLISLLDVSPDRTRALLRIGPRGDRHIVVRDLLTGVDEFVTAGEQAVFGPDGETVYARSESGELPVLIRVAKGGVEVLASSGTDEVESFTITADGRTAAVLWNVRGGLSSVSLLDLDTGARRPLSPQPGLVISGPAWSFDGSTLGFTAEGPGQPHGVWVSSAEAGVVPVSAEPPAPGAVQPTLETFPAHDGLELTGWLFRPDGEGPFPTVLWFHGGPEAQERPGHGPLFQSLVDRGIAVFAPNVRGSSGFGRSFVNADNLALRYAAIEDVRSCVRHLTGSNISDISRLGIMGRSYGGYLTLAALTTFPDMFAVGIDVCGMSNFATFYEHTEPWIAAAAVSKYGDPVTDSELLADLSPITRIDRLRTPLMIVHGENDSNVPVIEAEQVVAALAGRGLPHRYLLFPGEGHELLNRSSRADYLRETVNFLVTYLSSTE
ncbi:S9 family peptidase [Paractinoplanes brasiliensis]|uniref:Dipeptidyl aminopeptidase/acylaminoacyl peptidase n=1 Tax=Paractinoplanes brasiliensis TaxID=52695 RepID=A0A4R6JZ26_9ACTN|nr:S9 family peptidase [Actinoplanes brasiliensis]TDO41142.1 dipeptidyl aminopeptidase/acylaminoacyl peptidase [Actinoplanes brasiliensis]GID26212.1 peptidase S9 [Actinoplanes brasiliensis]